MIRWLAILLLLAAPHLVWGAPPDAPTVVMGIVAALDQTQGTLVLAHGDGTRSHLSAAPRLLRDIQVGDPVHGVVEGTTVRTLEPL